MKLLKDPKAPLLIRIISLAGAIVIAALIVRLVFAFGYYASGLAAHQEEERRRRESPIPLRFSDPNADANAPPPAPTAPAAADANGG